MTGSQFPRQVVPFGNPERKRRTEHESETVAADINRLANLKPMCEVVYISSICGVMLLGLEAFEWHPGFSLLITVLLGMTFRMLALEPFFRTRRQNLKRKILNKATRSPNCREDLYRISAEKSEDGEYAKALVESLYKA